MASGLDIDLSIFLNLDFNPSCYHRRIEFLYFVKKKSCKLRCIDIQLCFFKEKKKGFLFGMEK